MIIAFAGKRETGKSEAAGMLAPQFRAVGFADALREVVEREARLKVVRTDLSRETAGGEDWDLVRANPAVIYGKPTIPAVRRVLQGVGQAVRERSSCYWVMALARSIRDDENVAITDLRYANEAEWVRREGGVIVRMIRGGATPAPGEIDQHASETEVDSITPDYTIENNGSKADLWIKLLEIPEVFGVFEGLANAA